MAERDGSEERNDGGLVVRREPEVAEFRRVDVQHELESRPAAGRQSLRLGVMPRAPRLHISRVVGIDNAFV